MATIVHTKAELKAAIKAKADEILILDPTLAKQVMILKSIKKMTKWTLVAVLASIGAGATFVALNPAAMIWVSVYFGIGAGPVVAGSGGIAGSALTTTQVVAVAGFSSFGAVGIYAIWRDYDVIEIKGPCGFSIKLTKGQGRISKHPSDSAAP